MAALSRQVLEQIATSCSEAILVLDSGSSDFTVRYVNPAYEALTGYSAEEAVGHPWRVLDESGEAADEVVALKAALGRAERCVATIADVRSDGTSWLSRVRAEPIFNRRGELKQFLLMQAEITASTQRQRGLQVGLLQRELRRARQKAANLDRVDPASGLLRYDYFVQLADRDCRIARRDRESVAVALFEINDLAAYEQTFGTKAADSCLRMIGAQVTGALRRTSDICGCDEQKRILAFTHGQDAEELGGLAKRIAENVRSLGLHNPRGRSGRYVTVRFSVAACSAAGNDALTVLVADARAQLDTPGEHRSAQA